MKSFASDNYSGIAPEILQAIIEANTNHAPSYGADSYTENAIVLFKKIFGESISVYFVTNGTAANTLGLKAVINSHHSIICADTSHLVTQEVGACISAIGCMVLQIPHQNGKITPSAIEETYNQAIYWGRHNNKPKVVSIAQSTEFGTVYTLEELAAISRVCKKHTLLFHMDGCRLANAAVALDATFNELTVDVGVDILSFGGTKNGLAFGEAIVFLKPLDDEFEYIHKQELQLLSKMRFLSAQFIPYLEQDIWKKNATQANLMCKQLYQGLKQHKSLRFAYPVETNQLFVYFTDQLIKATQDLTPYYIWNKQSNLVRLVTSFDTTAQEVENFLDRISECVQQGM